MFNLILFLPSTSHTFFSLLFPSILSAYPKHLSISFLILFNMSTKLSYQHFVSSQCQLALSSHPNLDLTPPKYLILSYLPGASPTFIQSRVIHFSEAYFLKYRLSYLKYLSITLLILFNSHINITLSSLPTPLCYHDVFRNPEN